VTLVNGAKIIKSSQRHAHWMLPVAGNHTGCYL